MVIPYSEQYFVEKDRNFKFLFLSVAVSILLPILHGLCFLWVPWILRGRRRTESLRYKPFFTFIKYYETATQTFNTKILGKVYYYQPSLLFVAAFHVGINTLFAVSETRDLTYETWYYIVAKRVGRLAIAHLPITLILVAKNNIVSAASGLTLDKTVFFHKWYGRSMFVTATIHMALSLKYWLGLNFKAMVLIPPQIFGFIAFSCLAMMNIASLKFIRNMAFDLFLAQHRIVNFIMLLLIYFHNGGNHAAVILGVHLLVADRIVGRVMGIIHKRRGPTKGLCDFEILDESTVRVSIPMNSHKASEKWYWFLLPRYKTWRAGQHVLFNCNKVALLAYHPFTIASLPESGKMVLVIKVQKGFTKQLYKKLCKLAEEEDTESTGACSISDAHAAHSVDDSASTSEIFRREKDEEGLETATDSIKRFQCLISGFKSPRIFNIKAGINGPFGANYQPLTKFDSVLFFSAGSGATFVLPVALDLLQTLQERDDANDYLYRPQNAVITIVMTVKSRACLQWFDHLWGKFLPFFNCGRANLLLHLTQEEPEATDDTFQQKKEKVGTVHEGVMYFSDRETSSSQDSSSFVESGGVSISYGRPDIEGIIKSSVQSICSPSHRKAFACVGCGPRAFNARISSGCNESRWLSKAPDVYYYAESFE